MALSKLVLIVMFFRTIFGENKFAVILLFILISPDAVVRKEASLAQEYTVREVVVFAIDALIVILIPLIDKIAEETDCRPMHLDENYHTGKSNIIVQNRASKKKNHVTCVQFFCTEY